MARVGIQITKSTLFRGVQQEFHNVYYYQDPVAITTPAESLIDEIVVQEKLWHSTVVNFLRASAWSAGGTPAQNQMLHQKNLSGTGSAPTYSFMDRERAYLIQWAAGFDVRGNPVKLRKWYHTCGNFGTTSVSGNDQQANIAAIAAVSRSDIAAQADNLDDVGVGEAWTLCSKGGRAREGQATCHPYLEHHQLGEMWR